MGRCEEYCSDKKRRQESMEAMTFKKKSGVLIISPFFHPNIGGVETHLSDLTEYLSSDGYKTYVLTYKPITTDAKALSVEVKGNIEIHRFWWFGFNLFHKLEPYPVLEFLYLTPWLFIRSFIWLLKNDQKIWVIHAQGFNAAFISKVLAKLFNKKFIASTHAIYGMNPQSLIARLMLWTLNSADKILTLSKQSKGELTRLGMSESKIDVYTYWVNQDIFKPTDKIEAKKKLGWDGKFIVLFIGRFIKIKGIDILFHVAKRIKQSKIYFSFIGDGPMNEEVQRTSNNLSNVIFVGKVDNRELPTYYNASDIFIIPSLYEEGFGRVILEALSCGVPVIASNRGGIPEAMDNSIGFIIEPKTEEIIKIIMHLYEHPEKLETLSKSCIAYARKRFSKDNAKIIENAYVA